ncbi:MAG: DUF262 domain-containing protein [Thermodesulfovibrionales bacterium]
MKRKANIFTIEEELFESEDFTEVPPPEVVAYNELRSCADIYRMHEQGILKLYPEFQRDVVWQPPAQTRFVDSLIKQLPIPSMCFSYDAKAQEWLVIDGLQRIFTIVRFLKGEDWQLSDLVDIDQNIAGKSVSEIKDPGSTLHKYYTKIENLTIPITVLRCNHSDKHHLSFLFIIFHRLNSEGMKLNNQEIRNCIYGGNFNRMLKTLDETPSWRKINKMKKGSTYRFTKQELILRIFAFSENYNAYTGHLAKFLNDYMFQFRLIKDNERQIKEAKFIRVSNFIYKRILNQTIPPRISNTLLEALFISVMHNIDRLEKQSANRIRVFYRKLESANEFSEESLKEGLSKKDRVIERINKAISIFS